MVPEFSEGYWWARAPDGTAFVVQLEAGLWHCCGQREPLNGEFEPAKQVFKPIPVPVH